MKKIFLTLALIAAFCSVAMAETKTISKTLTAAADGTVSETLTDNFLSGYGFYLYFIRTTPSGTTAPTTLYDVEILDADGKDILGGAGLKRSATVTETAKPLIDSEKDLFPVNGNLTIRVTNAGNGGITTMKIYFVRP